MGATFLHGAAVTIHKAQGSQWDTVQVFAPDLYAAARMGRTEAGQPLWKRLAYVAITRAQERLIWVVRNRLSKPTHPLRVGRFAGDPGRFADIGSGRDMKSIIVTGASSGIGRATAQLFLSEGWTVGLLARGKEKLETLAKEHQAVVVLPADVTDPDAVERAFGPSWTARGGWMFCSTTPGYLHRAARLTRSLWTIGTKAST